MDRTSSELVLFFLLCFFNSVVSNSGDPPGHLQPLGAHAPPVGAIPTLDDFPDPPEFFRRYVDRGQPVLFRNVLKRTKLPAYTLWTDDYLGEKFGDILVDVEEGKKEDRNLGMEEITLKDFLKLYKTTDIYMVQNLSSEMKEDIYLPRCLVCGGFQKNIFGAIAWFSSGGTRSVLHSDEFDNINCLLDGTKDFIFISPSQADLVTARGWMEGTSYSTADVDKVDMHAFPEFQDISWYSAHMEKGDCLFIPSNWFHQVNSAGERNLAVNIWFYHIIYFNNTDCVARGNVPLEAEPLTKHAFSNMDEFFRTMILSELPDQRLISKEDILYAWELLIPDDNIKMKVFEEFDTDKNDNLSWEELMAFNVSDFVETYKKYLGNDFMIEYKKYSAEFGKKWMGNDKEQEDIKTKEEL